MVAARPEIVLSARNGERGELASARAYGATARHFDLCEARYGAPTVALSLIRSNERRLREETLRDALREALDSILQAVGQLDQVSHTAPVPRLQASRPL